MPLSTPALILQGLMSAKEPAPSLSPEALARVAIVLRAALERIRKQRARPAPRKR